MTTRDEIKKVCELLNGETMVFDHSTYEFEEDIPHLIIDGVRENIDSVSIYEDGTMMTITTEKGEEIGLGFYEEDGVTFEVIDKEIEEMGMDTFLRDIYYNHPRSYEIGDYEEDFLK